MAKVKHFTGDGTTLSFLNEAFDPGSLLYTAQSKKSVTYVDTDTEWSIVVSGTNLRYKGDIIIGGTIDRVTFLNADDDKVAQISDFKIGAMKFRDPVRIDGITDMYAALMSGKDTITGSGEADWLVGGGGKDRLLGGLGSDTLEGGRGDDVLTGGGGSDVFVFGRGDGKDVITDFVANGPLHDTIGRDGSWGGYTIGNRGNDMFIALFDGSEILVRNMNSADFNASVHFVDNYEATLG